MAESNPSDPSRRRFLRQVAAVASAGVVPVESVDVEVTPEQAAELIAWFRELETCFGELERLVAEYQSGADADVEES